MLIKKTIFAKCIYQSEQGLKIYQNFFYRWLSFNGTAIQTLIHRYKPHQPGLAYVKQLTFGISFQEGNCCLLGLGGANVAHVLRNRYSNMQIDTIENNGHVIFAACNYFMLSQIKNMRVILQDAVDFIQNCTHTYTHLLIDLFNESDFPNQCNTIDFFSLCKQRLNSQGLLAINVANESDHWPILQLLRQVFENRLICLPVKNTANLVLLAYNHSTLAPILSNFKQHQGIKEFYWDTTWGYIAILK